MIYLASLDGHAVNCETISSRTRLPQGYLAKVLRDLVCADLVKSYRGPHGGFVIARDPATITMLEVVNAVDPIRRIHRCPLNNPRHTTLCPLHQQLDDALAFIEGSFRAATLDSVLRGCIGHGGCQAIFPVQDTGTPEADHEHQT